jgi:predicted O-methyltransferase YrrM
VFLDAERDAYVDCLPELVRTLAPAAAPVVDNVVSHAGEVAKFRARVDAERRLVSALVPTGAGALFVVRVGD